MTKPFPPLPVAISSIKTSRADYRKQAKLLKDSGRFDNLPADTKAAILDRMKKLGIPWETL
jgi:hypothetical protein